MKLATSSQMQALDQTTINQYGIPGIVLMENAGVTTLQEMERCFGPVQDKTVVIFIGPGNNGGDGLVIGRHVVQRGGFPLLVFLVSPEKLRGDAGINTAIARKLNLPMFRIRQIEDLEALTEQLSRMHFQYPVHSLVDALFGTGLKREISGRFAATVHHINSLSSQQGWPVSAVDIPSGLSADTGESLGCSVQADLTVTYGLAKPGHYHHGSPTTGQLVVRDIGIPPSVVSAADLPGSVLDATIGNRLLPRPANAHKGTCGHLLIIAGSEGKTGAAILCARAALRSGCGLVTMAVPSSLNAIFETTLPEAMTVPLPCSTTFFSNNDDQTIMSLASGKQCVVLGPGLDTHQETAELVKKLYSKLSMPMVLDADGLNLLAGETAPFLTAAGPRILTPHPGEMARMTGLTTAKIQADRLQAAGWLQQKSNENTAEIITILKGAGTVLHSTRGQWAINSTGNSGMATGGMGDVLAGLIGSLLAQGYPPWQGAKVGVYMHGLSADLLAESCPHGYGAAEVASKLPEAYTMMQENISSLKGCPE